MMKNTLLMCALMMATSYGCAGEDKDAETDTSSQTESSASEPIANTVDALPWTFLVNGIFHNNVTVSAGSGSKSNVNEGHWINFKEDRTYEYGVWGDKQYAGNWFYNGDTNILDLTPDDDHKKSQWRVMHKDDNLIWMGTSTYGDNAIQIQWLRREGYPLKPG